MKMSTQLHYPGAMFHVMCRRVGGTLLFHDEADYLAAERQIHSALRKHGARCHAYCLMPNHVHALIQVGQAPLFRSVHAFETAMAMRYNRKHESTGHVFQGPFRRQHLNSDAYLSAVVPYIHSNPVKAQLVERAQDYAHSSYRAYAGLESSPFVTTRYVLEVLGRAGVDPASWLNAAESHEPAWEVVDDACDWPASDREPHSLDELVANAAEAFGVGRCELLGPSRGRHLSQARRWLAEQARTEGYALSDVARLLNRTRQSIHKLVSKS